LGIGDWGLGEGSERQQARNQDNGAKMTDSHREEVSAHRRARVETSQLSSRNSNGLAPAGTIPNKLRCV